MHRGTGRTPAPQIIKGDKLDGRIRFLTIYAYVLGTLSLLSLFVLYIATRDQPLPGFHIFSGMGVSLYYMLTAVGLFWRKRWGYYLFKLFLYLLLLGFPIGTIISYKSMSYMRQSNVKSLFTES
jgi:hypothetical protein